MLRKVNFNIDVFDSETMEYVSMYLNNVAIEYADELSQEEIKILNKANKVLFDLAVKQNV